MAIGVVTVKCKQGMTRMTDNEIQALWAAAKRAGLDHITLQNLSIKNPFTLQGEVAQRIQSEISRSQPELAQQWIEEAQASMSLAARAAALGLEPMTPKLRAEIERFTPVKPEVALTTRIEELIAQRPYGRPAGLDAEGNTTPALPPNITAAIQLEALAPQTAADLKAQMAPPAAPAPGAVDAEGAAFINSYMRGLNSGTGP